jgi:DNA invertase Pin-like site-specific DNA recombinase
VKIPQAATPAIAYSYLRFSKPEQADGDSLRRQRELRESWLKRNPHIRLDTYLKMVDRGVSGYRGDHRKKSKHALACFLDLVERGRVPAGSYLIVENLDRLTRENPVDSIPAVLDLIRAGIRVVQLVPVEMVYDQQMQDYHLMSMLFELSRGHAESRRKSGMCGEAWAEKKAKARADKTPHGAMCPAWIELVDGQYRLKEDAARVVRKIYDWSASGLGVARILGRLEAEKIAPIGKSGSWERSYVCKLLRNQAVIGVYQPGNGSGGRRPDGDPIPGYYPSAIDESLFYAAQQATEQRRLRSGRPSSGVAINPFSGLLWSAHDGSKLHVVTSMGHKYLVNSAAIMQRGERRGFPLLAFKEALLSQLRELSAADLFRDPGALKVTELEGRLSDVEKRLTVALAKFEADPESPTWSERVSQYDRDKRALVKELADARAEAQHPLSASWSEAVQLMEAQEPERLRTALLATIESIWCLFVPRGKIRFAAVQVWFAGGEKHRDYLIVHKAAVATPETRRPSWWDVRSLADVGKLGPLDLRRRADVQGLEKALLAAEIPYTKH